VLVMLLIGMLLIGGQFGAYTYIAPYLKQVGGATDASVSLYLLVYGAASAVGMFAGGAFADRGASRTLIGANLALPAVLLALYASGGIALLVVVLLAAWGFIGFGLVPSLQLRVVGFAGPGAELAATLSASAINIGIAGGSAIGGVALERWGVSTVLPCAAALCALALPVTWYSRRLKPGPGTS
jgi:DHA1 family inner membrane transport protein